MASLDPSMFPHLSAEHRGVLDWLAQALGDQAAVELLAATPEQQLGKLEMFSTFVSNQRLLGEQGAQAQLGATASLTADALRSAAESREALERAVNVMASTAASLSSASQASAQAPRAAHPRAVKIDAPKFDGGDGDNLTHWLLAVERCAKAQLIDNNESMVSFAISHLRGRASEWAFSALLGNADAFETWDEFRTKMKAQWQPPNNEVLLQGRFFAMRQGKLSLDRYVQEMRSICAAITVDPLPESVKVPAFLNGLNAGPARQALYRHLPTTMEEAIRIALIEQQSFRASRPDWSNARPHGQSTQRQQYASRYGPSPMDLSSVDVTCYNCGKRGHFQSKCPAPRSARTVPQARNAHATRGNVPRRGGMYTPRRGNGPPQ